MEYRGYRGIVTFDDEAGPLHGEVAGTRDVITFQGDSMSEMRRAFMDSVDEYLAVCAEKGRQPDRRSGESGSAHPPGARRTATRG